MDLHFVKLMGTHCSLSKNKSIQLYTHLILSSSRPSTIAFLSSTISTSFAISSSSLFLCHAVFRCSAPTRAHRVSGIRALSCCAICLMCVLNPNLMFPLASWAPVQRWAVVPQGPAIFHCPKNTWHQLEWFGRFNGMVHTKHLWCLFRFTFIFS